MRIYRMSPRLPREMFISQEQELMLTPSKIVFQSPLTPLDILP